MVCMGRSSSNILLMTETRALTSNSFAVSELCSRVSTGLFRHFCNHFLSISSNGVGARNADRTGAGPLFSIGGNRFVADVLSLRVAPTGVLFGRSPENEGKSKNDAFRFAPCALVVTYRQAPSMCFVTLFMIPRRSVIRSALKRHPQGLQQSTVRHIVGPHSPGIM